MNVKVRQTNNVAETMAAKPADMNRVSFMAVAMIISV